MSRPQSRARRQAAFLEDAKRMYEQLEDWYDRHPEASFGEIEAEVRKRRRELMGKTMERLVNGRDSGVQVKAPTCERCGEAMEFEGYCGWGIHGLEGDSRLERAYYVCPNCEGQTLFPPGSETEVAGGPLE
jgi:ribosomal protein S27AE